MKRHGPLLSALAVVALTWVYLFPYSGALNNPNERTRVLQARAIVEKGQLHLGEIVQEGRRIRYRDLYGRVSDRPFINDIAVTCLNPNDEAPRCAGRLFPAKAPGTALLGAPFLWVAERFGAIPEGPPGESRATWVLRLATALVGLLGLAALGLLAAKAGVSRGLAAAVVIAAGLGTGLFPYSVQFVGHAAAGAALIGGAYLLYDAKSVTRASLAGLVASAAVLFEYHAALGVAALGVSAVFLPQRKVTVAGFALGALCMLAVHMALHDVMFGNAFRTGHMSLVSEHNRQSQSGGFLGLDGVHFNSLAAHLGDPYMGLFVTAPWLLAALTGLGALAMGRAGPVGRALATAAGLYLLFVTGLGQFRTMNGWSFGPRYLTPALPVFALGAAVGLEQLRTRAPRLLPVALGVAGFSVLVFGGLVASYPSHPADIRWPFGELATPLLKGGFGVRNLGLRLGRAWLVPYGLLLLGAVWLMARHALGKKAWRGSLVALALAVALATGAAFWRPTPVPQVQRALDFEKATLEGASPSGAHSFF